jgi:hypothetical protein
MLREGCFCTFYATSCPTYGPATPFPSPNPDICCGMLSRTKDLFNFGSSAYPLWRGTERPARSSGSLPSDCEKAESDQYV